MKKIIIAIICFSIGITGFTQSSLYISAGANAVVTGGTAFVIDGFALQPTALYTITGENRVTRDAVTVPASPTPI